MAHVIMPLWPELDQTMMIRSQLEVIAGIAAMFSGNRRILMCCAVMTLMIPSDTDYAEIGGLSAESIDILSRNKPETIGQATVCPG